MDGFRHRRGCRYHHVVREGLGLFGGCDRMIGRENPDTQLLKHKNSSGRCCARQRWSHVCIRGPSRPDPGVDRAMVGQECFHGSMRRGGLASSARGVDADQGRPISRVQGALCTIHDGALLQARRSRAATIVIDC